MVSRPGPIDLDLDPTWQIKRIPLGDADCLTGGWSLRPGIWSQLTTSARTDSGHKFQLSPGRFGIDNNILH